MTALATKKIVNSRQTADKRPLLKPPKYIVALGFWFSVHGAKDSSPDDKLENVAIN